MKKRNPILGIVCLLILCGIGVYTFLAGGAKAEITINGKAYEMRTITVREFMEDGFALAVMSQSGSTVYAYDYSDAVLEAKTYYNTGVPFKVKGSYGNSLDCWLYNPSADPVEIWDGKICAISCDISKLLQDGVAVSVAGLELNGQAKTEVQSYMDGALKGYTVSEIEDLNAVSYTKGQVSYTFSFDDDDVLVKVFARNSV